MAGIRERIPTGLQDCRRNDEPLPAFASGIEQQLRTVLVEENSIVGAELGIVGGHIDTQELLAIAPEPKVPDLGQGRREGKAAERLTAHESALPDGNDPLRKEEIQDIFVTHTHTDHLLGCVWMMRMALQFHYPLRIWSHRKVLDTLTYICHQALPPKEAENIGTLVTMNCLMDSVYAAWATNPIALFAGNMRQGPTGF